MTVLQHEWFIMFKFSFGFETHAFWHISFSCGYIPDILNPWSEGLSWKELGRLRSESLPCSFSWWDVFSPQEITEKHNDLSISPAEEASQPAVKDWYKPCSTRLCHFPWTHSVCDYALWASPLTAVTGGSCHEQEGAAFPKQLLPLPLASGHRETLQ